MTFALSAGYADAYYKRAMAVRGAIREEFASAFEAADVLISATSPFPAFGVGEKAGDPLAMYLSDYFMVPMSLAPDQVCHNRTTKIQICRHTHWVVRFLHTTISKHSFDHLLDLLNPLTTDTEEHRIKRISPSKRSCGACSSPVNRPRGTIPKRCQSRA